MNIGSVQKFQQKQLSKVERRKEEDKKIKKGIYQMQVMIDGQCMDTLTKECEKSAEIKQGQNKRTDIHTGIKDAENSTKDDPAVVDYYSPSMQAYWNLMNKAGR